MTSIEELRAWLRQAYTSPGGARLQIVNAYEVLDLLDRLERAERQVAKVEALHRPVHWHVGETAEDDVLVDGESHGAKGCMPTRCSDRTCGERGSGWPCATRAALATEEATP